jgi:acyl-CoA thioesterase
MQPITRETVPEGQHNFHPVVGDELEFVKRMWYDDAASRALGMEVLDVSVTDGLGEAYLRMRVGPLMVNGHDICHGGYIFTFCDTAFAMACNAKGSVTVAAGCDINYVAPAHNGDVLLAHAVERVVYGRSGLADVTITREGDSKLIAEFRGRARDISPRS